jgi:homoserine O-succinyltransferase
LKKAEICPFISKLVMNQELRLAIIDLYDGYPNEGMRCIKMLADQFFSSLSMPAGYQIFDLRGKEEVPAITDFDVFISSGGPGSPLMKGENWENLFCGFLDELVAYNTHSEIKKHAFLICHSFQLMVQHFQFGLVCERKSTSFGVMPIHKTEAGKQEILFEELEDPFWAVDSRDFQVIQPDMDRMKEVGAEILALEKIRPHVPLERAVMGIRLSDEIVGFQFHPEADAEGMKRYFQQEEKRMAVIAEYGEEKLLDMLEHLEDPDKILHTEAVIIPKFLEIATNQLLTLETN